MGLSSIHPRKVVHMNKSQLFATGLVAALVLGTVVLMPAQSNSQATNSVSVPRQAVSIIVAEVSAELPQDQVRDLTY
jgi:hypothetical protein